MKLWLARHAQPLVASGLCYGKTDVPADGQATEAAAKSLAQVLPSAIAVYFSPLQRCEQLSACLRWHLGGLTYKPESRIAEMDFGQWEGRLWADIPKAEIDAWTANFAHHRAGTTGESVRSFVQRVADALADLPKDQDALWITHAGVVRAVHLLAAGKGDMTDASQWPKGTLEFGQFEVLQLEPAPQCLP